MGGEIDLVGFGEFGHTNGMSQRATDRRIPPELESEMSPAVRAFVGSLLDKIDRLETVIDGLRKTPENSSLPPSSQHPHAKPPRRREKTKRRRGGQPGHRKHERTLIPTEQCDSVVAIRPSACRRCGKKLPKSDKPPLRHQVWEVPEIKPSVTEYQLYRSDCDDCGETTCAKLPPGVPRGQSGPRLVAFAALLMAYFRQSKRRTALFLNMPAVSMAP